MTDAEAEKHSTSTPEPLRRRGRPSRGSEADVTRRVLDAARDVFLKEGFDAAKLDAIAAAAGASKRTFYARFSSKADVFEAVVQRMIEEAFLPLAVEQGGGSHRDRLHKLAEEMLTSFLTPDIAALERMVTGVAPRFPDLAQRVHELARMRGIVLVERCLAAGIAAGEFTCIDPRFAAEYFLNATIRIPMILAAGGIHSAEMTFVKREVLRRSVDLFLDGVAVKASSDQRATSPAV